MEALILSDEQKSSLNLFMNHVDQLLNLIETFEPSRPGSIAFTKFEEGLMWAQVMISHSKKKEIPAQSVA